MGRPLTLSQRRLREAHSRSNSGVRERISVMPRSAKGRDYFWLTGIAEGKPFLLYGGMTFDEANEHGLEMLAGVDFQIKKLPTRNISQASRMCKYGTLANTHNIVRARERLGHDRTIKREQVKKSGWGL